MQSQFAMLSDYVKQGTKRMEENKNSIFRKKSLDRISSPEELDHYLAVTGPGVWFTLLAVIVLLIGVFAWMTFGRLDTKLQLAVVSDGTDAVCYVPEEKVDSVLDSARLRIADAEYTLKDAGLSAQFITEETDESLLMAGGLEAGMKVVPLRLKEALSEGVYSGEIVVETVNPISYIIN